MPYKKISTDLIDPNPWQTRKKYDEDALVSLMASATNDLGIRQVPLVRPYKGRYQIAFGHGRIEAWKGLEKKEIMCRVEELTDSQMKKELLVENVNRSDLDEEERFQALEQFREDLGLKVGERNFLPELSKSTGMNETTLREIYDVQQIRQLLKVRARTFEEEPSAWVISRTVGLPDEERVKLVVKAMDMGWSSRTTLKVKKVLRDMELEVRALILEEERRLPHRVIVAIGEIEDIEVQKAVIAHIQMHKLDEELALNFIKRAKEGPLITEVKVIDEPEEVLSEFNRVFQTISGWGVNQYKILGKERWKEALVVLEKIFVKLRELMATSYE